MISQYRVYINRQTGEYTFEPPESGVLVCVPGGEVPREFWESLTLWLSLQDTETRATKNAAKTKAVKPVEDK